MDIDMKTTAGKFKYRVAGILIDGNGRLLIQKISENSFYCLPGGHVELGETSREAAERELKEELRFDVTIDKTLYMIENIFTNAKNKTIHEIGMYFKLSSEHAPTNNWDYLENDKGVLKNLYYKWVTKEELKTIDFRPSFLKEKLFNFDKPFSHFVIKNNVLL